jgi:predicted Zn-dependent protease
MIRRLTLCILAASFLACSSLSPFKTSPLGRTQLRLFPAAEMDKMGIEAYSQMKQELPQSRNAETVRRVTCVSNAVTAQVRAKNAPRSWEVTVFEDDSANAFALPGGKIGVHTGLLKVAASQDELATVIGHEIAHVLAEHGNERASTTFVAQSGLQVAESLAGPQSAGRDTALAVLGLGTQVGVLLPFSRKQESEADLLGLDLMARAGFDPRASVTLWQNMARSGGGKPPEMLSTHPSSATRISELSKRIPQALPEFEAAHAAGRRPHCY